MPRTHFDLDAFLTNAQADPDAAAIVNTIRRIAQPQQPVVINNYYVQNASMAPGPAGPNNATTLATYNNRYDNRNANHHLPRIETPIADYNGTKMSIEALSNVNQSGVLKRFYSNIVLPMNLQRLSDLLGLYHNTVYPPNTRNKILSAIFNAWENLPPVHKNCLEGVTLTKSSVDHKTPSALLVEPFITDSALLASALASPADRKASLAARKPFITLCPICHSQYAPLRDILDPKCIFIPTNHQKDRSRFSASHSYLPYGKLVDHFSTVTHNDSPTFVAMHRYMGEILFNLGEYPPLWKVIEDEYNVTFPKNPPSNDAPPPPPAAPAPAPAATAPAATAPAAPAPAPAATAPAAPAPENPAPTPTTNPENAPPTPPATSPVAPLNAAKDTAATTDPSTTTTDTITTENAEEPAPAPATNPAMTTVNPPETPPTSPSANGSITNAGPASNTRRSAPPSSPTIPKKTKHAKK